MTCELTVHQPAVTPAAGWLQSLQDVGIDDIAAAQPPWDLRYDQLSPGRLSGSLQQVRLPGLRLCLERFNRSVRQRGQIGADSMGFAMALSEAGPSHFHGLRMAPDSIMIGRGDELDLTTPDDCLVLGIVVDADLLSQAWQRLYLKPWSPWLDEKLVVTARPGMARQVRDAHLRLLATLAADPTLLTQPAVVAQLRDNLLIDWLEAIPSRVDLGDLRSRQARRQWVDRACAVVLARPDHAPSLLELCREVGASPRKLDYCFREVLGLSPSKYLKAVRLNGARRELARRPDEPAAAAASATVHDIAARWGFWHMGAFSADYKRQFGELPSATLRKARDESARKGSIHHLPAPA